MKDTLTWEDFDDAAKKIKSAIDHRKNKTMDIALRDTIISAIMSKEGLEYCVEEPEPRLVDNPDYAISIKGIVVEKCLKNANFYNVSDLVAVALNGRSDFNIATVSIIFDENTFKSDTTTTMNIRIYINNECKNE